MPPLSAQLVASIDTMLDILVRIVRALTIEPRAAASVPHSQALLEELVAADAEFMALVRTAQAHSHNYELAQSLAEDLARIDALQVACIEALHSQSAKMQSLVASNKGLRTRVSSSLDTPIDAGLLLSYAQSLAPYTSAPPQSLPAKALVQSSEDSLLNSLPVNALPPFPTEAVMRRGRLHFGTRPVGDTLPVGDDDKLAHTKAQPVLHAPQPGPFGGEAFDFALDLNPDL